MKSSPRRTSVAIVVPPNAQSLDVSGLMDVLLEANRLSGEGEFYECSLIATSLNKRVRISGMDLIANTSIFDGIRHIDTLLVAGTPDYAMAYESRDLCAWLQRSAPLTRRCGAVGTGAFFLGAAGLLDGKSATTHWQHITELADRSPAAKILPDHRYVEDGALYTSAGVTAGIDLALKLIEDDHGLDLAREVARSLVFSPRHASEKSQFRTPLTARNFNEVRIHEMQNWILDNLSLDLTLKTLAARAGICVRHFTRVFQMETGSTPGDFVEMARVDAAKRLIEGSNLLLEQVALRCGFANSDVMRRAFLRRIGLRPSLYRESLRTKCPRDRPTREVDVRASC